MRVAVGFDHAGFLLRASIVPALEEAGHEVVDCGTDSSESVDYPVHGARAASLVAAGTADRAVLVCGSGAGMSIVANKFAGVRAVNVRDPEDVELARRHNDANVIALAGRRVDDAGARRIVETFLATEFDGGRHQRRVDQIEGVERGEVPEGAAQAGRTG
jgi:ribose 5-phosphate isomerase B